MAAVLGSEKGNGLVLIIGAGGALELSRAKRPFLIVEAQDRIGGRLLDVPLGKDSDVRVELGANWIHNFGDGNPIENYAKNLLKMTSTNYTAREHISSDGKLVPLEPVLPRYEKFSAAYANAVSNVPDSSISLAAAMKRFSSWAASDALDCAFVRYIADFSRGLSAELVPSLLFSGDTSEGHHWNLLLSCTTRPPSTSATMTTRFDILRISSTAFPLSSVTCRTPEVPDSARSIRSVCNFFCILLLRIYVLNINCVVCFDYLEILLAGRVMWVVFLVANSIATIITAGPGMDSTMMSAGMHKMETSRCIFCTKCDFHLRSFSDSISSGVIPRLP